MPNNIKIFGEIEEEIRKLVLEGYNATAISKIVGPKMGGITRATINSWVKKNHLQIIKLTTPAKIARINKFIELIKSGKTIKEAKIEVKLRGGIDRKFLIKHNVIHLTRNRAEAALDRLLSLEEATNRLPPNSGKVIGYEQNKGKYIIEADDGFIYHKNSARLCQGDPRGKSGSILSKDQAAKRLFDIGYILLSESYISTRKPLKATHIKCGRIRENRLKNFTDQECPSCNNNGTSRQEMEVKDWIESLGLKTEKYKFEARITRPKEIDIYVPSLKLGVEYCGLHWHGEKAGKTKNTHYDKYIEATKDEIQLITIFEHEWRDRQVQVKSFLRSKLNHNNRKFYARQTEIKEVDPLEAKTFLESYHIQGKTNFIVAFGLYSENELLAVVTGNRHHRMRELFTLNRLCFKENVSIVGGSSKLNSALIKWAKENGFDKIITWSDNRWSIGKVYEAMGYTLEEELGPDYFYNNDGEIKSKQSCQKKHLLKRGAVGKTELEMSKSLGYDRLWDCGKKRWVMML